MRTKQFKCLSITKSIILSTVCFLLLPGYLIAQKNAPVNLSNIKWQLDATVSGVKFYHAMSKCNGEEVVFLKFDNTNKVPVKVSWKEKFDTQFETKTMGAKGVKEMTLAAGITTASGCNENDKARKPAVITGLDVQPHYVAEIKAFEFIGITVKKQTN